MRIPASFNGVVGYKTSTGRIDKTGLLPLARSYDTIGPLARSVEDCILADMADAWRGDLARASRRPFRHRRLLVSDAMSFWTMRSPRSPSNFERSLEGAWQARGARVRRERVDVLDRSRSR